MLTIVMRMILISTMLSLISLEAVTIKNETLQTIILKNFCKDDSIGFPNLYETKRLDPGKEYEEKNIISFDAVIHGQCFSFSADVAEIIEFYQENGIIKVYYQSIVNLGENLNTRQNLVDF